VDESVGELLDLLQQQNRLRNTLIVFLSDNGIAGGEHRWSDKLVPYERSIQVPMVVRFDPLTAGRHGTKDAHLVLNIDLAPTFYELVGVSPPGPIDGSSMVPLLSGDSGAWRSVFLIENLRFPTEPVPTYCAARSRRWKYVVYSNGFRELYDLRHDPFELTNLAGERPAVRKRMHEQLLALCSPPPPDYSL
jgi:arylsulfatase A-like enzyme